MSYELQRYLSFIGILLNLFLGLLALTHTRRNSLYRSFFMMNAVLFFWNFSHYSYRSAFISEPLYPVLFQCSLALIPSVLLHFIYRLTDPGRKTPALLTAYAVSIIWCAVFVFTGLIESAACVLIFGASLIAILLWCIILLARSIRTAPDDVRKECEVVVLGGLLAFLGLGVLDYLFILIFDTYPFLSILGGLIFSAAVAWAVFTYHLLDLRDSLVRAAWTTAFLVCVYLIYLLISSLFQDFPGMRPLVFIISILGAAFLLSPIGPRRPREALHRLFFPDKVTLVDVINRFVSGQENLDSTEGLISFFLGNITAGLPLSSGVLYLKVGENYSVAGYTGGGDPVIIEDKKINGIVSLLGKERGFVNIPETVSGSNDDLTGLPLGKGPVKGFLLLRGPGGKKVLTAGEKRFLEIITTSFASSLARIAEREEELPAPHARIDRFGPLVGGSGPMLEIYSTIRKIAPSDSTILIQGESGTGKELVAQMIHSLSGRSDSPFIAVNCATLTGDLLKSELFGHEKGAFTGAVSRRTGRFEQAHGGTLFLDEIGEIPLPTQSMMLRVIEDKEIMRLGGKDPIKVDVRIITATNKNLAREVKEGSFREDLFYRLNVIPITVPPLRERKEDIPLLADYFIGQYSEEFSKNVRGLNKAVLKLLVNHEWPGNVRELANTIERAVLMASSEILAPGDIALEKLPAEGEFSLKSAGEESEKSTIVMALKRTGGNVTHAARLLGISRVTLQKKMKKHSLRNLFK